MGGSEGGTGPDVTYGVVTAARREATRQFRRRVARVRVGDYRIVYDIDDGELIVPALSAAHRREV